MASAVHLLLITVICRMVPLVVGRGGFSLESVTFVFPSSSTQSIADANNTDTILPRSSDAETVFAQEVPPIQASYPLTNVGIRMPYQAAGNRQLLNAGPTYIGIFPNLVGNDQAYVQVPAVSQPFVSCPAPAPCDICPTVDNATCGIVPSCPTPAPCNACPTTTPLIPTSGPPMSTLNQIITTCGEKTSGEATLITSAPKGTISLYLSASNYVLCYYKIVAHYPATSLNFTCSSIPGDTFVTLQPVTPITATANVNTTYTSTANYINVYITNEEISGPLICSWTSIP